MKTSIRKHVQNVWIVENAAIANPAKFANIAND